MKRIILAEQTYDEVYQIVDDAFRLKDENLYNYRKMIQDIQTTAGKLDADIIIRFFSNNSNMQEAERSFDLLDTACRDKIVDYALKWRD